KIGQRVRSLETGSLSERIFRRARYAPSQELLRADTALREPQGRRRRPCYHKGRRSGAPAGRDPGGKIGLQGGRNDSQAVLCGHRL
ncbi:hypothetical protein HK102_005763, partial [Quaeritorhiza haematococci]